MLQVAFSGSFTFLRQNLFLFPAVTVFACLQVLVSAFVMLALSSMSKSSRFVAILYAGAYFFSHAVFGVIYAVTGSTRFSWISLPGNLKQVGDLVFRLQPRYSTPPLVSVSRRCSCSSACRSGCSNAGSAAWRWCRDLAPPAVRRTSDRTLSKWYGQVIGLNDVTVSVPAGVTGLLGPNGAGKSTFMKLMTGQLQPSKGSITVLGEPVWGNPSVYFRIGFCPDQDAFYDRMTGLEWVAALVRLNGFSDEESVDAARRALDTVDLLDAADRKIGELQQGDAPAGEAGPGRGSRPRAAGPRRAALGHGPAGAAQDDPPHQGVGARRQDASSSRATSCTRSRR